MAGSKGGSIRRVKSYRQALDYLFSLEKFGMIFGLDQVGRILKAIGDPHRGLRAVHIGGTNGKGSTAAMVAAILRSAGYRVGLYTSPHLERFTERIRVDGQEIEEREVASLAAWMRKKVDAAGIEPPFTFFDFTTALALLHFMRQKVDLAVLEVGLGGRLDSTNVVDPLLSIVTNVARDHEEQLGRTVLAIAREKAGIIKRDRPFLTAANQPPVVRLFSKTCAALRAPFFRVGTDVTSVQTAEGRFDYQGLHRSLEKVSVSLRGPHQVTNAALAVAATEILGDLGVPVPVRAVRQGLRETVWPGRLEMISTRPRVLLDGAHNPAGAAALREALEKGFRYRRLILLAGIMKDKDRTAILRTLGPLADRILVTAKSESDRTTPPALLLKALGRDRRKAEAIPSFDEAIRKGLSMAEREDLLLITGSLYLVGEARAWFGRHRGEA
jgi:dihydrofolate synthase / folylpolyglutamate synthase